MISHGSNEKSGGREDSEGDECEKSSNQRQIQFLLASPNRYWLEEDGAEISSPKDSLSVERGV